MNEQYFGQQSFHWVGKILKFLYVMISFGYFMADFSTWYLIWTVQLNAVVVSIMCVHMNGLCPWKQS